MPKTRTETTTRARYTSVACQLCAEPRSRREAERQIWRRRKREQCAGGAR